MTNRWGKGEPVNLSDLLKITPVANEIMHLSEELNISVPDLMWIVSQIIDNNEEMEEHNSKIADDYMSLEGDWEEIDLDSIEDDLEQAMYLVNVKINGTARFPEIGFKAGINDKEDMTYFFDMIMEMLDKLD